MARHAPVGSAATLLLVGVSLFGIPTDGRAACDYVVSTVRDQASRQALGGVHVFVVDDSASRTDSRWGDGLFALEVANRGRVPYTLEFQREGHLPQWKTGLDCTLRLRALEVIELLKEADASGASAERLQELVEGYVEALSYAKTRGLADLGDRIRQALYRLRGLLQDSPLPPVEVISKIDRALY